MIGTHCMLHSFDTLKSHHSASQMKGKVCQIVIYRQLCLCCACLKVKLSTCLPLLINRTGTRKPLESPHLKISPRQVKCHLLAAFWQIHWNLPNDSICSVQKLPQLSPVTESIHNWSNCAGNIIVQAQKSLQMPFHTTMSLLLKILGRISRKSCNLLNACISWASSEAAVALLMF